LVSHQWCAVSGDKGVAGVGYVQLDETLDAFVVVLSVLP
jgi:hypothetical protein